MSVSASGHERRRQTDHRIAQSSLSAIAVAADETPVRPGHLSSGQRRKLTLFAVGIGKLDVQTAPVAAQQQTPFGSQPDPSVESGRCDGEAHSGHASVKSLAPHCDCQIIRGHRERVRWRDERHRGGEVLPAHRPSARPRRSARPDASMPRTSPTRFRLRTPRIGQVVIACSSGEVGSRLESMATIRATGVPRSVMTSSSPSRYVDPAAEVGSEFGDRNVHVQSEQYETPSYVHVVPPQPR